MPAHQLDLLAYFKFLFDCDGRRPVHRRQRDGGDGCATEVEPDRTPDLQHCDSSRATGDTAAAGTGPVHGRSPVRHAAGSIRSRRTRRMTFGFADTTNFGVGNADFPSLWNQRIREGMHLHWDGNNTSVFERNISAAIGAGATPVSLDMPRMLRIRDWIQDVPPPVYPPSWKLNSTLVKQGETIYGKSLCGLSWSEGRTIQEPAGRHRGHLSTKLRLTGNGSTRTPLSWSTTSTPWELVNTGSFMNFARPTATPTIRLMESGPWRHSCTMARCRRCATCSTPPAPSKSWSRLATLPVRRDGPS